MRETFTDLPVNTITDHIEVVTIYGDFVKNETTTTMSDALYAIAMRFADRDALYAIITDQQGRRTALFNDKRGG